jgi:hypothetical protein
MLFNIYFDRQDRDPNINLALFLVIGILMFALWYLLCIFLFSTLGISIIESMPKPYLRKNFKYLFFIRLFTSRDAYGKIFRFANHIEVKESN